MRTLVRGLFAAGVSGLLGLSLSSPALAQPPRQIDVGFTEAVARGIARQINVPANQIPSFVQVPVEVAAKACGVDPNVLHWPTHGNAVCIAKNTSPALNSIVRQQIQSPQAGEAR